MKFGALTVKECEWMNAYPPGTIGYQQDEKLIKTLLELCNSHGYGYVPQLTELIKDAWMGKDQNEIKDLLELRRLELAKNRNRNSND